MWLAIVVPAILQEVDVALASVTAMRKEEGGRKRSCHDGDLVGRKTIGSVGGCVDYCSQHRG